MDFSVGDEIQTPYGPAIVRHLFTKTLKIELLSGVMKGQQILIDYEKSAALIKILKKKPSETITPLQITEVRVEKERSTLSQKRCIDALRFGLVPMEYISELTLGYEEIKNWAISTLPHQNQDRPLVHHIVGPFGEGKSHTLSIIRYLALQEGYLVSRVEVDGKQVTLAKPDTFLFSLFSTLEGKDLPKNMPVIETYRKAIQKGFNGPYVAQPGDLDRIHEMYNLIRLLDRYEYLDELGYLIDAVLTCNEDVTSTEVKAILIDETKDRIPQKDINLFPIIGRTVKNRPNEFVEALVGTSLVGKLAGYKGLIVTIDECEVDESISTSTELKRKIDIFDALIAYFTGNSKYVKAPIALYFASVPTQYEYEDEYCQIDTLVSGSLGQYYNLTPFTGWDHNNTGQVSLVKKIHEIYKESYHCDEIGQENLIRDLDPLMKDPEIYDSGGIRYFMKRLIGLLDSTYGPPHQST